MPLPRILDTLRGRRRPALPARKGGSRGTGGPALDEEEVTDFLLGELLFVSSSNVAAAQYHPATGQLMVEFLAKARTPASAYLYDNVSEAEAENLARAGSKGGWIWDHLRVRGSATAHRKPFRQLR